MHADEASFGETLQRLRIAAGLTQAVLADHAGVSVRAIQNLEHDLARPHRDTTKRLSGALGLDKAQHARFIRAAVRITGRRDRPHPPSPAPTTPSPAEVQRTTLPAPLTPLVGRARETERIQATLSRAEVRVLTLTGPGGVGKTRLAIEVAGAVQPEYPDGVVFTALAAVRDATLVPAAIALALGVREAKGQPLLDAIAAYVRQRRLLLVLDNCEHLPDTVLTIRELLAACPQLTILATSRAPLHLRGEQIFPVGPLAVPPPADDTSAALLVTHAAVTLFVGRAQAVNPALALTSSNARDVAAICRRLDGLPLAIELAAVHCRYLTPGALLARLAPSLPALVGGPRDLPERQQTLRGTIAWSYDLLPAEVRQVFRGLAVCAGGCDVEAAAAICLADRSDSVAMLDHLDALVLASLLVPANPRDGEPRFGMLETIREFGMEMLAAEGELRDVQARHAAHYLALAVEAESRMRTPQAAVWLTRLETEHDNQRAALSWAAESGEAALALRLSGALWRFWYLHGHLTEGRRNLRAALSMPCTEEGLAPSRARALYGASVLAMEQGDIEGAATLSGEALTLYRAIDDRHGVLATLNVLALAARGSGDLDRAASLLEEALALARTGGNQVNVAMFLTNLGVIAVDAGRNSRAVDIYVEALGIYRQAQDSWGVATSLTNLGEALEREGRFEEAARALCEGIVLHQRLGHLQGAVESLQGLALVAMAQGRLETAARLFGAASALRQTLGFEPNENARERRQRSIDALRAAMDGAGSPGRFEQAWSAGGLLSGDAALAEALAVGDSALP